MLVVPHQETTMAIAITVQQFLNASRLPFDVVAHPHSRTSLQSARAAHIAPLQLGKAVLLEENGQLVMAVLPAAMHVHLGTLRRQFNRDFGMATEQRVRQTFGDCEPGAIPALGGAYGIETIWDDSLMNSADLYFEAGDHEHLVHVRTEDFLELVRECKHGDFGVPV
jgi:Ala-tRNA(Pro) deacylase